jgi:hypothetical protein
MDIIAAKKGGHPRIRRQGRSADLLAAGTGSAEEISEECRDSVEKLPLQPFALPGHRRFETADNITAEDALRVCYFPFRQRLPLRIEETTGEGGGAEIKSEKEFVHSLNLSRDRSAARAC